MSTEIIDKIPTKIQALSYLANMSGEKNWQLHLLTSQWVIYMEWIILTNEIIWSAKGTKSCGYETL